MASIRAMGRMILLWTGRWPVAVAVVVVTLLFGLWPLRFRSANEAAWLQGGGIAFHEKGVASRFCRQGIVFTERAVAAGDGRAGYRPVTIELDVESRTEAPRGLGYILSFEDGGEAAPLIIAQWQSHLVIRSRTADGQARAYREAGLANVLRTGLRHVITIAADEKSIDIYVDGEPAQSEARGSLVGLNQITGRLVLGNSALGANAWAGNLYWAAVYGRKLSADEIRRNCTERRPNEAGPASGDGPVLAYAFDEGGGAYVGDRADGENDLVIPRHFVVLRRDLRAPFRFDFELTGMGVIDVVINVLGFMPMGWCVFGWLSVRRRWRWASAAGAAVLAGLAISLAIEITQVFLPMRNPSLLDTICNVCGTVLGVGAAMFVEQVHGQDAHAAGAKSSPGRPADPDRSDMPGEENESIVREIRY